MEIRSNRKTLRSLGWLSGALAAALALVSLGCVGAGTSSSGAQEPGQAQEGQYAVQIRQPTGVGPASMQIANHSNEAIYYIYMSPSAQSTWGQDLLGNQVLQPGQSFTLSNIGPGQWDLRVVDSSGNSKEWRGAQLQAGGAYSVEVGSGGWRAP